MKKSKLGRVSLLIIAAITALLLVGCELNQKPKESAQPKTERQEKSAPVTPKQENNKSTTSEGQQNTKGQVELTLYFANPQGDKLVAEKRLVEATQTVARAALEELIKGPSTTQTMSPTIPPGTQLLNVTVANNVAKVNFSSEFADNHSGGSSAEVMTIYSVVNTLTEFSTIKAVEFFVNQEKLTALGSFDLTEPVKRRNDLL